MKNGNSRIEIYGKNLICVFTIWVYTCNWPWWLFQIERNFRSSQTHYVKLFGDSRQQKQLMSTKTLLETHYVKHVCKLFNRFPSTWIIDLKKGRNLFYWNNEYKSTSEDLFKDEKRVFFMFRHGFARTTS